MFRLQQEITRIEFEIIWELIDQLKNAIKELNKNWRQLSFIPALFILSFSMSTSSMERMTERQEIFFYQSTEAFPRSVVWIQEKLAQCSHLACAIPSMPAMK
mmetsp:Transcript_4200/g.8765  ORF Transcript_4200/g.8765 Transcript_4200/m.8765 type:complete len:102 (-) Transcript_4200:800-1105(-)